MRSKSTIPVGLAVVLGVSYAIASRQGAVNNPDNSDWLYVGHNPARSLRNTRRVRTSFRLSNKQKLSKRS